MPGFLVDQPFPGATTCVVIGDVAPAVRPALAAYRHLLWWTDAEGIQQFPTGLPRDRVQTALLENGAAGLTIERFLRRDPRHLPSLFVSETVLTRHADAYQAIIAEVHAVLESHHRARVTRQKDGFTWQSHLLQNAAAYSRAALPAGWAGKLAGVPAFIVGAGPSLDVSAPLIAAHAGRAVIFSADSALHALARHGLRADFVVSIDAAKAPGKCLPASVDHQPAHTVLSLVSPPAWQQAVPAGSLHFVSSHQITEDWLNTRGVTRPAVAAAENCGATALEIARFLGCAPLYLFGLDLAASAENPAQRHHAAAEASLYTQSGYDPAARMPTVPGNYAETVPTFALGDWRALDQRLASRATEPVFNVNDRGARFRGTVLVHPRHFDLAPATADKAVALARLTAAPAPAPSPVLAQLAKLQTRAAQARPALQAALAQRGPAGLADAFRPLLIDPELSRFLGAFALKLMPHLVPPIETNPAQWQNLLDEFAALTALPRG